MAAPNQGHSKLNHRLGLQGLFLSCLFQLLLGPPGRAPLPVPSHDFPYPGVWVLSGKATQAAPVVPFLLKNLTNRCIFTF